MKSIGYTLSPLLASKTPVWRSRLVVALLALVFVSLVGRAAHVQVLDNAFFQHQGEVRFVRTLELPASRGRILDRNGFLLASSVVAPSISAISEDVKLDPDRLQQLAEQLTRQRKIKISPEDVKAEINTKLQQLARLLEMRPEELDAKFKIKSFVWLKRQADESLISRVAGLKISGIHAEGHDIWAIPKEVDKNPDKRRQLAGLLEIASDELDARLKSFVWLKRQVDESVANQVAALQIPGIYQSRTYKRKYPEGEAFAHVIGSVNIDNLGQEGVELSFEKELAGKPGSRRVIRDRLGRVVETVGEDVPPVDGQDIQLSIDSRVQFFAYQKVRDAVLRNKAKSGSVVVLDAQTGEVLALANYPSYNPNDRGNPAGAQRRDIAVTDAFEPGSVMKPITIAMALEAGKVTPQTVIDTSPGYYKIDKFTIRDTHDYGALTVEGVIQKSSNIGALKIAQRLNPQQMWETYTALGYGRGPDMTFPGATARTAAGRLWPWKRWGTTGQATIAYGYGISASLLQMAHSYTVFAHDGAVIPLTLLKSKDGQPVQGVQVFSEQTVRAVRKMLQMAAGPGGTGQRAQTVGYSVGGKSGTARKQQGNGYAAGKYRAWFDGLSPIDQPRVIVAVMIDEPGNGDFYGGLVAAPVFSEVVQQTLRIMGVRPDMAIKPQIVSEPVEEPI